MGEAQFGSKCEFALFTYFTGDGLKLQNADELKRGYFFHGESIANLIG